MYIGKGTLTERWFGGKKFQIRFTSKSLSKLAKVKKGHRNSNSTNERGP
jgi:hypothetical protein